MDLLADILKSSGLKRRILEQRSPKGSDCLNFPCDKSIGFHVVTQGEAVLTYGGKKTILLKKSDVVLMARGVHHQIESVDKNSAKLQLVSGAYQFWHEPIHPFFSELPDWYVLRSEEISDFEQINKMIEALSREVSEKKMGAETVIQSLLDIIFSMLLRKIVEIKSQKKKTWSYAVTDLQIKQTVEKMHLNFSKPWTLDALAKLSGMSRAGFADKFKVTMGETPLKYLTMVRMQKAVQFLVETEDSLEQIAEKVGYQDPFSFSKVFKKLTGLPPREFRKKDREALSLSWRF